MPLRNVGATVMGGNMSGGHPEPWIANEPQFRWRISAVMSRPDAISPQQVRRAAPLFAALGDMTRLQLLARLCSSGPGSITRLATKSRMSRQAITKHLTVLSDVGLIKSNRRGRERIWEITPERLVDARAYLDQISHEWDNALHRLKVCIEE
jgi:DNA-binding transcriptional ArsR family regulator